eukprot:7866494-Pyramimonas_sp.AAC.1
MTSWIGDRMEDVTMRQYNDADLASDLRAHRSASARNQVIWAPDTSQSEHGFSTTDLRVPSRT